MQKTVSKIHKALVFNQEISLAVLDTTALVQEAIDRHHLTPVAAAALGRTLTVSAYLCSWLKGEEDSLSVTVKGNGAGGKLGVSGDSRLHMRGFIENPQVELPPRADGKLDVGGCVGNVGTLTVIREEGEGLPFVGTSELVSGEIAEDFSAYFFISEQRPTAIAVGVKISPEGKCVGAGGVIMQPLPNASEESILATERAIANYGAVSSIIEERGAESILRDDFSVSDYVTRDVYYRCHCSRDRIASLILSMGKADAEEIVKEEGKVSVHCHYCNTDYEFDGEEVSRLFAKAESGNE